MLASDKSLLKYYEVCNSFILLPYCPLYAKETSPQMASSSFPWTHLARRLKIKSTVNIHSQMGSQDRDKEL